MTKFTPEVVIDAPAGADELALAICAAHDNRPDELLEIFHDLQHELGYVPEQVLPVIANLLNRSRAAAIISLATRCRPSISTGPVSTRCWSRYLRTCVRWRAATDRPTAMPIRTSK